MGKSREASENPSGLTGAMFRIPNVSVRGLTRSLVGAALAMAMPAYAAEAYPNKPIRFLVPYPPGDSTDPSVMWVAQMVPASDSLQQTTPAVSFTRRSTVRSAALRVRCTWRCWGTWP